MGIKLLEDVFRIVRTPSGRIAKVFQIEATEDFAVKRLDQEVFISKGERGGYIEKGVFLGKHAWLKDTDEKAKPNETYNGPILFGRTKFFGFADGYARVEDSTIKKGSVLSLGRAIVVDSKIGESVLIRGTSSIKKSTVGNDVEIIGTIIRNSEIHDFSCVTCAGTVDNEDVFGLRQNKKTR